VTLPLFELYPGCRSLPVAGIASLPTPVASIPTIDGVEDLWVKRDDLTSPVYGGNKVRKLDFLLGQARAEGRRAVLTFGAYGSNHALATAVHASALGLEPHVVLSPQDPGPYAPRTLLAHAALGTRIHLAEGWDGRRDAVRARQELVARDGIEPFVIPMGGTCPVGVVGFVNAALELVAQARNAEGRTPVPDVVYVAAGTLGTAVGLAIGFAAAGAPVRVEAVRVTPLEICNEQIAATLAAETVALLRGCDATFPELAVRDLRLNLRHDLFEPGYGIVTDQTRAAVDAAARSGLVLETTYTGKAIAAMLADARDGLLGGQRVLFWDTYNSAPFPAPGDVADLPEPLQAYVAECRRAFPES
jgi:D-cysteine desulfhydrase